MLGKTVVLILPYKNYKYSFIFDLSDDCYSVQNEKMKSF